MEQVSARKHSASSCSLTEIAGHQGPSSSSSHFSTSMHNYFFSAICVSDPALNRKGEERHSKWRKIEQVKSQRQKGAGGVQDSEGWSTRAEAGTEEQYSCIQQADHKSDIVLKTERGGNAVQVSKSSQFSQLSLLPLALLHEMTSLCGWVVKRIAHITTGRDQKRPCHGQPTPTPLTGRLTCQLIKPSPTLDLGKLKG